MATTGASQIPRYATRILVYGFGPYRHFQKNVTETILRLLPRLRRVKRIVFPVKFHRTQFIRAVTAYKPDVILGLGQCSRGSLLRLETAAYNRRRSTKRDKPKPIVRGGARKLSTTLPLKLGRHARASRNPGDYVCNYSMYVLLRFLKRRHRPVRFGFIHVPHKYKPRKALRLLVRALRQVEAQTRGVFDPFQRH